MPTTMVLEQDIPIRVRYQETDAMGVLHHANYFTYFEIGRTELLRANGRDYRQVEEEGMFMVVVRIGCTYKKPAKYDDVLTLRTRVSKISAAKIEHAYEIYRGEELLAEGHSTLACVDREGRVQRVPEWLRGES
ncbi:MAG TPA: thioesterase family protein [Pirellulales bacterium]|nr:thioesterase family protein [Pirellulales bacterium]